MQVKLKVLAGVLALVTAASCLLPAMPVSAAEQTVTISDRFDDANTVGGYDFSFWSAYATDGVFAVEERTEANKALQFKGAGTSGESAVLISKDWYWELHSLSFDVKFPQKGEWIGVDFPDILDPKEYLGDFGENGDPMCYGACRAKYDDDFGFAKTDWTYWGFDSKSVADQWVSVKIVPKTEKTATIYMAPQGQSFRTARGQDIVLSDDRSFHNCNIVFTDYAFSGYMLDNIVIETDTGTYTEDFSDDENDLFELITLTTGAATCSTPVVEEGVVRSMRISNAIQGDRLVANEKIAQQDEYMDTDAQVLDVSFRLDMSNAQPDQEVACVFGIEEQWDDPFAGTWGCVMNQEGCRLVSFEEDGSEKVLAAGDFRLGKDNRTISLSLKKNGALTVLENGKKILSYNGVTNYGGYMCFAAKTEITEPVYLDDVTVSNGIYNVITTKSYTDDFSTNRLGNGGPSDYACHAEGGTISVSNDELVFSSCLDGTYFGSAYEYETFELSFELTSILATDDPNNAAGGTYLNNWIGIDFGKKNPNIKDYGSYGMYFMRIRPETADAQWDTVDCSIHRNTKVSPLTGEKMVHANEIPASYFKDITYDGVTKMREEISPDAAVCFKLVATEDRMELYMKRADQEEYTLYNVLTGVDPAGYIAIACTGYTYWSIDNFEIKNTAKVFNEAPEVVIELPELVSDEERGLAGTDANWEKEVAINASYVPSAPATNWLWIVIGALAFAAAAAVAVVVVIISRKRKNKEAGEAI